MKLYILRHEDRTKDCTLFSPLTELGLSNSFQLKSILNNENINIIYSSPYIRALQTVYYYAEKYNIKINIELGLGEIQIKDLLPNTIYHFKEGVLGFLVWGLGSVPFLFLV